MHLTQRLMLDMPVKKILFYIRLGCLVIKNILKVKRVSLAASRKKRKIFNF